MRYVFPLADLLLVHSAPHSVKFINKKRPSMMVFFVSVCGCYCSGVFGSCGGIKLTNSDIVIPVAFNTLAMLYVDGQRG